RCISAPDRPAATGQCARREPQLSAPNPRPNDPDTEIPDIGTSTPTRDASRDPQNRLVSQYRGRRRSEIRGGRPSPSPPVNTTRVPAWQPTPNGWDRPSGP